MIIALLINMRKTCIVDCICMYFEKMNKFLQLFEISIQYNFNTNEIYVIGKDKRHRQISRVKPIKNETRCYIAPGPINRLKCSLTKYICLYPLQKSKTFSL